jgi:hypothetical protein
MIEPPDGGLEIAVTGSGRTRRRRLAGNAEGHQNPALERAFADRVIAVVRGSSQAASER